MNYVTAIKTAIFVFPIIAFLFTIPFILHQYHKYESINKLRVFIIYSFILYMITIYFLVILPLPSIKEASNPPDELMRLIPFSFVMDFIKESSLVITDLKTYSKTLLEPCVYVALFNILMTIPFGMYLRYYFKYSFKKTIVLSFILSLFFEITQLTGLYFIYPYPYRLFDVDDLILNTLGGALGYFVMGLFSKFLPTRDEIDSKSIEKGKNVSGFRRITLFILDLFIYLVLLLIISTIFDFYYAKFILLLIYFVIIPYFWNGKTIGSNFLKVKLDFPNKRFIRLLLRTIFLYFYYFYFGYFLICISKIVFEYLNLTSLYGLFIMFFMLIIILFYIVNIFIILRKSKIYYDDIFKVKYVSTILDEKTNY